MKKISFVCIALLTVLFVDAQNRVALIREKLINRDQSGVIVASHRGGLAKLSGKLVGCY